MISLLIFVVLLTVTTHLISTIGAPAINSLLWTLYLKLFRPPVAQAVPKQAATKAEVLRLKTELASTSSQDQFARWAKARRTLDKKVVELEQLNSTIASARSSFDSRATTIRWLATTGTRTFIQFWYSRTPMFWIPAGWVPRVVEWLLAFPRAPTGSVSIHVWSFAVGQVVTLVMAVGAYALATTMASRRRVPVPVAAAQGEKKKA